MLLLQISACVGPVPTANVYTCWSCSYRTCLHTSVLFLLQMSSHVGPVPTANIYTCWYCSYCKCLHMSVLFLLQMSTYIVLFPTVNVLIFYFKQLNFKNNLINTGTVLQLPPVHDAQLTTYVIDFLIGILSTFLILKTLKLYFIMAPHLL